MNTLNRSWMSVTAIVVLGTLAASAGSEPLAALRPRDIAAVRINLAPWGATLGFESQIRGDEPRIETLTDLLRRATPGQGHKCANAGAIRFSMHDGSVVGVGLLPGHTAGFYDLRFYERVSATWASIA